MHSRGLAEPGSGLSDFSTAFSDACTSRGARIRKKKGRSHPCIVLERPSRLIRAPDRDLELKFYHCHITHSLTQWPPIITRLSGTFLFRATQK